MKRVSFAIVLAVVATIASPAHAQEPPSDVVVHRVKKGDTLELLAAEFYGDRNKAVYIMVANKLDHPRKLNPGERLRIPVSRPYTTAPGDTFETIAASFLGDARRGTFLAEFNGLHVEERIASGTELVIPFTITHVAESTETISQIAAAYFGNDKNSSLIRRYNFLDKDALDKGERVIVPIINVRLQASKLPTLDAGSRERRERQKRAQTTAATAIPAAKQAWRAGDFVLVRDTLAPVLPDIDFIDTAPAIEIGVLMGATYLAFDDKKSALEQFKRVLERKRDHTLSDYLFSKKVLDVWDEARRNAEQ